MAPSASFSEAFSVPAGAAKAMNASFSAFDYKQTKLECLLLSDGRLHQDRTGHAPTDGQNLSHLKDSCWNLIHSGSQT